MKINWGTGIVIAFILFMSFILFFVFRVQSNSKYDNELVVEKYYLKEQTFERDLERENNALALHEKVVCTKTPEGIEVAFPSSFDCTKISGKVSFYRPSSQKLDFEIPISLSSPHLLIPKSALADGRWDISIHWTYEGKGYLSKQTVFF